MKRYYEETGPAYALLNEGNIKKLWSEPSVTAFTSCLWAYTTSACAVIGRFGRTTI
jgi:hypothetical protein